MITNLSPAQKPSFSATPPQTRAAIDHIYKDSDFWDGKYKNGANAIVALDSKNLTDDFAWKVLEKLPEKEGDETPSILADRLCNEGKAPLLTAEGLKALGFKVEPYNPEKPVDSFLNMEISNPEK